MGASPEEKKMELITLQSNKSPFTQNLERSGTLLFNCCRFWKCSWCLQSWKRCLEPTSLGRTPSSYCKTVGFIQCKTHLFGDARRFRIHQGRNPICRQKRSYQNEH